MSGDEEDIWWEAQDQMEEIKNNKVPASEFEPAPMGGKKPGHKFWHWKPPGKPEGKVMDALNNIGAIEEKAEDWIKRIPNLNSPFMLEGILLMRRLIELHKQQVSTIHNMVEDRKSMVKEMSDQKMFLDSLAQAEKEGRLSWTGMCFSSPVRLLAEGRVVTLDD